MAKMARRMIAALALLGVLPATAFAEFRPTAAQRAACGSDAVRLCSAYRMNMDLVIACLGSKKSELSPGCRAQYEAHVKSAAQK